MATRADFGRPRGRQHKGVRSLQREAGLDIPPIQRSNGLVGKPSNRLHFLDIIPAMGWWNLRRVSQAMGSRTVERHWVWTRCSLLASARLTRGADSSIWISGLLPIPFLTAQECGQPLPTIVDLPIDLAVPGSLSETSHALGPAHPQYRHSNLRPSRTGLFDAG